MPYRRWSPTRKKHGRLLRSPRSKSGNRPIQCYHCCPNAPRTTMLCTRCYKSIRLRYYRKKWGNMRSSFLEEFPFCAVCLDAGKYIDATEVDHIEPWDRKPERFYDRTNLRSLCKRCHSRKTAKETNFGQQGRHESGSNGDRGR